MSLQNFYQIEDGFTKISAEQASMFAKEVAEDFNPLHDVGAKRFCVPGDLLFAIVLEKYGLSQNMHFIFSGMVGDGTPLRFPDTEAETFSITDQAGKEYLRVERSGDVMRDEATVERLMHEYVGFSGQNFPYIFVPMLTKELVMFNLDRPLVIYESMTLNMRHLNFKEPRVELLEPRLEINGGKRATAYLHFQFSAGGEVVGAGFKQVAIGGLRDYEPAPLQAFVDDYLARKHQYLANLARAATA